MVPSYRSKEEIDLIISNGAENLADSSNTMGDSERCNGFLVAKLLKSR